MFRDRVSKISTRHRQPRPSITPDIRNPLLTFSLSSAEQFAAAGMRLKVFFVSNIFTEGLRAGRKEIFARRAGPCLIGRIYSTRKLPLHRDANAPPRVAYKYQPNVTLAKGGCASVWIRDTPPISPALLRMQMSEFCPRTRGMGGVRGVPVRGDSRQNACARAGQRHDRPDVLGINLIRLCRQSTPPRPCR